MVLTEKQRAFVLRKFHDKFKGSNCEICGSDTWAIDPLIMELREFAKGALARSPVVPLVGVHCSTCGNYKLLNAIIIGAVDEMTGEVVDGK
jgi:hypothetical protein